MIKRDFLYDEEGEDLNFKDFNCSLTSTIDHNLRNNSSKSSLCCPYNSSLDIYGSELEEQIQNEGFEIMPKGSTMKLNPKLVLIDKKYEQENNSLFDKGITNQAINLKKRMKWNKIANQGKNVDLFSQKNEKSVEDSDSSNEGF